MATLAGSECAVIGAGVVGISCGIALLERGYSVTLYDPEPPGSMTSSGNAGAFAFSGVLPMAMPGILRKVPGWLLDPCGPLSIRPGYLPSLGPWLMHFCKVSRPSEIERLSLALSSLMQASEKDTHALINRAGLQSLLCGQGALTVYKTLKDARADRLEWEIKAKRGVILEYLGPDDIKNLEPALENASFGWYTPQWYNTSDPYVLTQGLAEYFLQTGGCIHRARVHSFRHCNNQVESMVLTGGKITAVDHVVVAAGVWSEEFCRQLGERILITSERGYNTTLPEPGLKLKHQIIFGREKFVISNIKNGLRIGGAAEFAGLHAPPNFRRSKKLVELARYYLPALNDRGGEQWMGHRPSTPDSVPVIGPSATAANVFYAFGHGHYGLTLAATTGKLVAQSIARVRPEVDLSPFSITRFA